MDPFSGISILHKIPPYIFQAFCKKLFVWTYFIIIPLTFPYLLYQNPFNTTQKKKIGGNEKGLEPYDEKVAELIELRDNWTDIKKAPYQTRNKMVECAAHGVAETYHGFLRDTLAPLIKPGMPTYAELKEIIFGSDAADT